MPYKDPAQALANQQEWRRKNAARYKCYLHDYAKEHCLAARARVKAWRQNNPERLAAYRNANKDKRAQKMREWRAKHKERLRAYVLAYQHRNKLKLQAYRKERWRVHGKRLALATKKWLEKNRASKVARDHKRRALKKAATTNLRGIQEFVTSVRSKPQATCYYCERRVPTKGIHFDHIVALTKGGSHSADNLCVACPSCNSAKKDKPMSAWMKTRVGQQLLDL